VVASPVGQFLGRGSYQSPAGWEVEVTAAGGLLPFHMERSANFAHLKKVALSEKLESDYHPARSRNAGTVSRTSMGFGPEPDPLEWSLARLPGEEVRAEMDPGQSLVDMRFIWVISIPPIRLDGGTQ
jgi:hypothetical protein